MDNKIIELLKINPLTNSKLKYLLKIDDYQFKNNQIKFKLFKLIIRMNLFRLIIELIKFIPKEKQNKIKKIKIQKNKIRKLIKITKQENNLNIYKKKKIENKEDLENIYINDVDNTLIKSNYIIEEEDINTIKDKISKLINIKKDLLNLIISLCLILKDICDIQKISFKKYLYICIILKVLIFDFDIYDKNIKNEYKKIIKHFNKKNLITGGEDDDHDFSFIIDKCKDIIEYLDKKHIFPVFTGDKSTYDRPNFVKITKFPIEIIFEQNKFVKNFYKNIKEINNLNIVDMFKKLQYNLMSCIDENENENEILKKLNYDYNKLVDNFNNELIYYIEFNQEFNRIKYIKIKLENILNDIYDVVNLIIYYLEHLPEYNIDFTPLLFKIKDYNNFEDILKTENILLYNIFILFKNLYNEKNISKDVLYNYYFNKSIIIISIIYSIDINNETKIEKIKNIFNEIHEQNYEKLYENIIIFHNRYYEKYHNYEDLDDHYYLAILLYIKYKEYKNLYNIFFNYNYENTNQLKDIFIILKNINNIFKLIFTEELYNIYINPTNKISFTTIKNKSIYIFLENNYEKTSDEKTSDEKISDENISEKLDIINLKYEDIKKIILIPSSRFSSRNILLVLKDFDFIPLIIKLIEIFNLTKNVFYLYILYKVIKYFNFNDYTYTSEINTLIINIKNFNTNIIIKTNNYNILLDNIINIQNEIIILLPLILKESEIQKPLILKDEKITNKSSYLTAITQSIFGRRSI